MANDLNIDLSYIKFKEEEEEENYLLYRLFLTQNEIEGFDNGLPKENPFLKWLKDILNKLQFFNSPNMLL